MAYLNEPETRVRRGYTGVAVVAFHAGLLGWLMISHRAPLSGPASGAPIELVQLTPAAHPQVHLSYLRRQDLGARLPILPSPPALSATVPTGRELLSQPGNDGSAVDWAAEAHRALKAYEIRRDRPPANVIAGATRDEWWPQRGHHAGDRYKTPSGDWIVWISSNCYQIAGWHSSDPSVSAAPPHTTCLEEAANSAAGKAAGRE